MNSISFTFISALVFTTPWSALTFGASLSQLSIHCTGKTANQGQLKVDGEFSVLADSRPFNDLQLRGKLKLSEKRTKNWAAKKEITVEGLLHASSPLVFTVNPQEYQPDLVEWSHSEYQESLLFFRNGSEITLDCPHKTEN